MKIWCYAEGKFTIFDNLTKIENKKLQRKALIKQDLKKKITNFNFLCRQNQENVV